MGDSEKVVIRSIYPAEGDELVVTVTSLDKVVDLKKRIQENLPGNPDICHLRLIYAGFLMKDSNRLYDYLVPELSGNHVIHLSRRDVIESISNANAKTESLPKQKSFKDTPANLTDLEMTGEADTSNIHLDTASVEQQIQLAMNQQQWLMQVHYMNLMNAYMAWQHLVRITNHSVQLPGFGWPQQQQQQQQQPQQQQYENEAPAAAAVENPDANGDDAQPRDMIDNIYRYCRLAILLAVLYLYSSFARFGIVALGWSIILLMQARWFNGEADEAVERPVRTENNEQQVNGENESAATEDNTQSSASSAGTGEPQQKQQPQEHEPQEQQPQEQQFDEQQQQQQQQQQQHEEPQQQTTTRSAWNVFWATCRVFVSSFFSSLIPPPPAQN
ncbi:Homocysteine-responsive endoplasmic reticulum-resident ubiquitin-like domain member 2 protein [Trichinella pseudospiralis]|uniref:Homocysteine-responsive endoplasmic reticulum-resident ubiquitin-like domain member 2 protein n=1 Tax=Trichinella pseudospiralis TaxID=6337 RepID=A0A0V1JPU9_TRIPS|nr:Homocysteine-responsive endoplasmic reticulum-resident ubiquitin-like domain member 2 protein [Trichinella pseudospiralis]KRZ22430.1 Homocysteine-responsive endoplasmic reticulum-resident ubiquitin-like domain member 2 protein [Trichinella pseudospiralis]KRZ36597.1 Homocysteine-responsive endoplasmic reticulum-resident ubiquitin-like domain member 2 protein [Trichinella pseudospiralis]